MNQRNSLVAGTTDEISVSAWQPWGCMLWMLRFVDPAAALE